MSNHKAEGIADQEVLEAAFTRRYCGDYMLRAEICSVQSIEGPIPAARELALSSVRVTGIFVDQVGRICGWFDRYLYRNAVTGELEVWLHSMEVDAERRGGLIHFWRQGLDVLAGAGFQRARGNGGHAAAGYILAREGFEFDLERLPGFGARVGVGPGGDRLAPPTGSEHVVGSLVREIILDAMSDGRISQVEARDLIGCGRLDSPAAMVQFSAGRLSRRLLSGARYPAVRELQTE